MSAKKYIIRDNEIIFFSSKKGFITIPRDHYNFKKIMDYIVSDNFKEEELLKMSDEKPTLENVMKGCVKKKSDGKTVYKSKKGELELPKDIQDKILELTKKGYEFEQYKRFWERCLKNPKRESIQQLFSFISKYNLSITPDGCFLAYKGVAEDFYDKHSKTFKNTPGAVIEMPRENVVFNPDEACGPGLHCGTLEYAKDYASKDGHLMLIKVAPEDVVSVPRDCAAQKIRTCRYEVVEEYEKEKPIPTAVLNKKNEPVKKPANRTALWTDEECGILRKLINKKPRPTWAQIGERLSRSGDCCRKKWASMNK